MGSCGTLFEKERENEEGGMNILGKKPQRKKSMRRIGKGDLLVSTLFVYRYGVKEMFVQMSNKLEYVSVHVSRDANVIDEGEMDLDTE